MASRPRATVPWLLVVGSLLLTALFAFVMFGGYLPARKRIAQLESELKQVYQREADLQSRLAQQEQRHGVRERQLSALTAERDALVRRLEDLERELAAARANRRR